MFQSFEILIKKINKENPTTQFTFDIFFGVY